MFATTTTYSDRRGAPAGLLAVDGHVWRGSTRTRCVLQVDETGKDVRTGYGVGRPVWSAFEAGPCLTGWERGPRRVVEAGIRRERIPAAFADLVAERSVVCLSRDGKAVIPFRMRGSLWSVAAMIARHGVGDCINTDGGSQLNPDAVNPAVLGIVLDGGVTGWSKEVP